MTFSFVQVIIHCNGIEELPSGNRIVGQMVKPSGFENVVSILTFLTANPSRASAANGSALSDDWKQCFLLHMKIVRCTEYYKSAPDCLLDRVSCVYI